MTNGFNLLWSLLTFHGLITLVPLVLQSLKPLMGSMLWNDMLRFNLGALTLIVVSVFLVSWVDPNDIDSIKIRPIAQVWSHSVKLERQASSQSVFAPILSMDRGGVEIADQERSLDRIGFIALWVLFVTLLMAFLNECFKFHRLRQRMVLVRKIGRVRIEVMNSDQNLGPFSYRSLLAAHVVLPMNLIEDSAKTKTVILHELQHHRNRDTVWVYFLEAVRILAWPNPLAKRWLGHIQELQELACDEALIRRRKVNSHDYARQLVELAKTAVSVRKGPVGATAFFSNTDQANRKFFKRRIESMVGSKMLGSKGHRTKLKRAGFGLIAVLGVVSISSLTFAARLGVRDQRISLSQAETMARQVSSRFPVVVNDLVLKELNRYLGSPQSRAQMKATLERMASERGRLIGVLQKYDAPIELLAVPIVESGYQNLSETQNSAWPTWKAAGVWQFIRQTARNYGLRVDSKRDERLDVLIVTDAAMRLLQANHLRFKDWGLSLLAYNAGEDAVQKGIDATGSRDPWVLIRNGHEGDRGYLAKVMAAILIAANPEIVESF